MWCIVISIHSSLSFNISICFSQTTDPVGTKLIRNVTRWFSTYYLIFISLENPIWLLGPIMLSYWLKFEKSSQKLMELLCSSVGHEEESKMIIITSDWTIHFRLLLQNCCLWSHQTCHKCSMRGSRVVPLLFRAIWNQK
jgi:hypothetical protein